MIQFNLLPDVKREYIRAQHTKRMVITLSVLITGAALVLVIGLLFTVFFVQKRHMSHLTADIKSSSNNLKNTSDINKILTVQNQLNSLTTLHDAKQNATKIFPYIKQLTPTDVNISTLAIDFDATSMTITGQSGATATANKLATVNKFVDTLKFTQYDNNGTKSKAFSDVVLASFGRSADDANYSITLKFDPIIFSSTESTTLSVPAQVSTRSETERPGALFTGSTKEDN